MSEGRWGDSAKKQSDKTGLTNDAESPKNEIPRLVFAQLPAVVYFSFKGVFQDSAHKKRRKRMRKKGRQLISACVLASASSGTFEGSQNGHHLSGAQGGKHAHGGNSFDVCKQMERTLEMERGSMAGVPFAAQGLTVTMHFEFRDFGLFFCCCCCFGRGATSSSHRFRRHRRNRHVSSGSLSCRDAIASLADTFERLAPLIAACVALSC